MARLAGNRPRALVLSCHVLAHYPSLWPIVVASGAMAAVLMSRYGPGAYPSLPLQTRLLKSRDAVRDRGRAEDDEGPFACLLGSA
jgi:hypothetical protein